MMNATISLVAVYPISVVATVIKIMVMVDNNNDCLAMYNTLIYTYN